MTNSQQQLWNELESLLRKSTNYKGEVSTHSRLTADLQLDSMALLSLTVEIENHYKIILGNGKDVPETLGQVLSMIEEALRRRDEQKGIRL